MPSIEANRSTLRKPQVEIPFSNTSDYMRWYLTDGGLMRNCIGALALMLAVAACQDSEEATNAFESEVNVAKEVAAPSQISRLANNPQYGWLAVIRDLYSDEFGRVSEELQQTIEWGADITAAKLSILAVMKPFMDAHRKAARAAPDAELVDYLRANTAVAEALMKSDVKACTDVFQGMLDPTTTLPDATWRKMSDATAQLLRTARAAEKSPTTRGDVALTPEVIQAWHKGMKAIGAGPNTFDFLNDPARKATATLAEKCEVRVQMMQGALQLPEPLAAKIMLNVLH
jgi:hypothetical protein